MQKIGNVDDMEMLNTFNMGVGLVIAAPKGLQKDLAAAIAEGLPGAEGLGNRPGRGGRRRRAVRRIMIDRKALIDAIPDCLTVTAR